MSATRAALVRGVPRSLPAQAQRMDAAAPAVDMVRAQQQHDEYVHMLRQLVPTVIELPPDEALPDGCFVEDTCVTIGDTALMTRPGHPSRRAEVTTVHEAITKQLKPTALPHLTVLTMDDEGACLDGGDVLFTGTEVFVGLSKRTNEAGAAALARAFPALPVITVPVRAGLHLKSCVSLAGPGWIAVGSSDSAHDIRHQIEQAVPQGKYQFIEFQADAAANCVVVNGTILHRPRSEYPDVVQYEQVGLRCIEVAADELAKVDGALTCCSLLFS